MLPSQASNFETILKRKQQLNIDEAIVDFEERLKSKEIDSVDFLGLLADIAGNCLDHYSPSKFFVTDTGIIVIIDCEFPHVIQALNPNTKVFFSKKDLEGMLNDTYNF